MNDRSLIKEFFMAERLLGIVFANPWLGNRPDTARSQSRGDLGDL